MSLILVISLRAIFDFSRRSGMLCIIQGVSLYKNSNWLSLIELQLYDYNYAIWARTRWATGSLSFFPRSNGVLVGVLYHAFACCWEHSFFPVLKTILNFIQLLGKVILYEVYGRYHRSVALKGLNKLLCWPDNRSFYLLI